jgi:hypothetical protein
MVSAPAKSYLADAETEVGLRQIAASVHAASIGNVSARWSFCTRWSSFVTVHRPCGSPRRSMAVGEPCGLLQMSYLGNLWITCAKSFSVGSTVSPADGRWHIAADAIQQRVLLLDAPVDKFEGVPPCMISGSHFRAHQGGPGGR